MEINYPNTISPDGKLFIRKGLKAGADPAFVAARLMVEEAKQLVGPPPETKSELLTNIYRMFCGPFSSYKELAEVVLTARSYKPLTFPYASLIIDRCIVWAATCVLGMTRDSSEEARSMLGHFAAAKKYTSMVRAIENLALLGL